MFLPLGLLARLWLGSTRAAVLLSLIVAGGIEAIQLIVPGRDPSLADILFNAAGGAGGAVVPLLATRLADRDRAASARLSLIAAFVAIAVHALTAWALGLQLPQGRYFSFWGPELGHLAPTDARLTRVTLAGRALPDGWVAESEAVRSLLSEGRPLVIALEPGGPPAGVGGLYALYDDRQNEVLLLGRTGDELVLRLHRRSSRLRLDAPDIRVRDFFPRSGGRGVLTIRLERDAARNAYCATRSWESGPIGIGEPAPRASRMVCDLGFTLGRGWALLGYPDGLPGTLRTLMDLVWLGAFFIPLGLWARARWETVLGLGLAVASLLATPALSSLLPTPAHLYAAAAAGLCAGLPCVRAQWRARRSGGR